MSHGRNHGYNRKALRCEGIESATLGKLSSVAGKTLDSTGRVSHSEGIVPSLKKTSPESLVTDNHDGGQPPFLDLLGLALWIQHEGGE